VPTEADAHPPVACPQPVASDPQSAVEDPHPMLADPQRTEGYPQRRIEPSPQEHILVAGVDAANFQETHLEIANEVASSCSRISYRLLELLVLW